LRDRWLVQPKGNDRSPNRFELMENVAELAQRIAMPLELRGVRA
jgi:hypothetical protein